jgi:hypothetical protein
MRRASGAWGAVLKNNTSSQRISQEIFDFSCLPPSTGGFRRPRERRTISSAEFRIIKKGRAQRNRFPFDDGLAEHIPVERVDGLTTRVGDRRPSWKRLRKVLE